MKKMDYYFTKVIDESFEKAVGTVTEKLKEQGFGIVSEMDVSKTLADKAGLNFKPYKIYGFCNPHYAFEILNMDDKMGVLLPCNVVIQQHENGKTEVSAINPIAMMKLAANKGMQEKAENVAEVFKKTIELL